jgi:hypothetical protein
MKKFKLKRSVNMEIWNDGRGNVQHYVGKKFGKLKVNTIIWIRITDKTKRLSFRLASIVNL